ncbi:MAG: beta-galactosidase [Lentisphaerae bacterium]|nr:beta-galactosidase [Lentisphaerota bacterium]
MHVGVDYYPEHWPESRWKTDARLMRRAGFNVVRLAEFGWSKMEPEEGRFDFAWLDRALDVLRRQGIDALLGTPTASMPAWVAHQYPETLVQETSGRRITWGMRKDNCFTSPIYRRLSRGITRAMADHFRHTPNVIGWQTDNEFGCQGNICYCPSCRAGFQAWLRRHYGTLDALNRAWGTHFWGHTISAWEQIPIPDRIGDHNPGALLDWKRFVSWLNVDFQREQTAILRAACPTHVITHNCMGLFKELNYYDLAADLDFVSWDNYPVFGVPQTRYGASLAADVMRGLKKRNFWIMEQSAGPAGWGSFGRNTRPGEIRSVSYQQLAHGADGQIWFRWRSCTAGREQYWHGLLGHDGRPLRRYREAARTAREYHRLAKLLAGTTVKAEVAILYDYESLWALDIQPAYAEAKFGPHRAENLGHAAIKRYYNALFRAGVNADIVSPGDALDGYKVVIAPHLYLLPDALAARLCAFVKRGGVLLTDCRTAVKDATSLCHARTLPGKLAPALGIEIQEYESIEDPSGYAATGTEAFPGTYTAVQVADWILARRATALAGYTPWHMRAYALLTRHAFGKGAGWYCGAVVKEPAFYDQLMAAVLHDARIKPAVHPPEGVEASVREGQGRRLLFLINHTEDAQRVTVPAGKRELLSGKRTTTTLALARHGVAVVRLS